MIELNEDINHAARYLVSLFYKTDCKYRCTRTKILNLMSIVLITAARYGIRMFPDNIYKYGDYFAILTVLNYLPIEIYRYETALKAKDIKITINKEEIKDMLYNERFYFKPYYVRTSDYIEKLVEEVFLTFGAYSDEDLNFQLNGFIDKLIITKNYNVVDLENVKYLSIDNSNMILKFMNSDKTKELIDYIYKGLKHGISKKHKDIKRLKFEVKYKENWYLENNLNVPIDEAIKYLISLYYATGQKYYCARRTISNLLVIAQIWCAYHDVLLFDTALFRFGSIRFREIDKYNIDLKIGSLFNEFDNEISDNEFIYNAYIPNEYLTTNLDDEVKELLKEVFKKFGAKNNSNFFHDVGGMLDRINPYRDFVEFQKVYDDIDLGIFMHRDSKNEVINFIRKSEFNYFNRSTLGSKKLIKSIR